MLVAMVDGPFLEHLTFSVGQKVVDSENTRPHAQNLNFDLACARHRAHQSRNLEKDSVFREML